MCTCVQVCVSVGTHMSIHTYLHRYVPHIISPFFLFFHRTSLDFRVFVCVSMLYQRVCLQCCHLSTIIILTLEIPFFYFSSFSFFFPPFFFPCIFFFYFFYTTIFSIVFSIISFSLLHWRRQSVNYTYLYVSKR